MDSSPEVTKVEPGPALAIRARVAMADLPAFFGGAFGELAACAGDHVAGPPFAIYHSFDPARVDVEAVMPVETRVEPHGRVHALALDGGPAVQVRHVGSYDEMRQAYESIATWIDEHHRTRAAAIREIYVTPPTVPEDQRVTIVLQPLQ